MNTREFLQEVAKIDGWELVGPYSHIRCGKDCPITAVAHVKTGQTFDKRWPVLAGEAIGLSSHQIRTIIGAADFPISETQGRLRKRLLDATGLINAV